jgi:hypothetical protein
MIKRRKNSGIRSIGEIGIELIKSGITEMITRLW